MIHAAFITDVPFIEEISATHKAVNEHSIDVFVYAAA